MRLATTTGDFSPFCKTHEECIREVAAAGFKYIDFNMYEKHRYAFLLEDNYKEYARSLKELGDSLGIKFVQAHSPGGNPFDEKKYPDLLLATIRSIEVCGIMGIPNIVVHPGTELELRKGVFFLKNREFYSKLFPVMEANNVNVLTENTTKANMGNADYDLITGADMREFVEYVNHPLFHACWDTGHANCEGNQYDEIVALGEHLYGLHINDNLGKKDEHLMPYMGNINLDEIINAIIDINYKGYFTFESSSSLRPAKYWLGNRKSFEKDTRLAEPQLFMQQRLEKIIYNLGKYALESYNIFED